MCSGIQQKSVRARITVNVVSAFKKANLLHVSFQVDNKGAYLNQIALRCSSRARPDLLARQGFGLVLQQHRDRSTCYRRKYDFVSISCRFERCI